MDVAYLRQLLEQVAEKKTNIDEALTELKKLPYEDIGYANIDQHRNLRTGQGEVIFGQGKTPEQIISLIERCILLLFPACDPEVFHIYERIIRYIQKQY